MLIGSLLLHLALFLLAGIDACEPEPWPEEAAAALLAFKAVADDPCGVLADWARAANATGASCSWDGVACAPQPDGHVVAVNLIGKVLTTRESSRRPCCCSSVPPLLRCSCSHRIKITQEPLHQIDLKEIWGESGCSGSILPVSSSQAA